MITFKSLKWSNAFSYGEDNVLNIDSPLIQLVGRNGNGKSSVALILEEILYNKNSKGIKKANVLNRYIKSDTYSIELEFSKDGVEYQIITVRGNTQKVSLFEDGEDISEHTATATYKLIEKIIGYDHKTFCQIIYQSNAFSLEFLTSTDSNRKKFLIDLLNLSRYTEIGDKIKADLKEVSNAIELLTMKRNNIASTLAKIEIPTPDVFVDVPEVPKDLSAIIADVDGKITHIQHINTKIRQNNTYKTILDNIVLGDKVDKPKDDLSELMASEVLLKNEIAALTKVINNVSGIPSTCRTCGQPVDISQKLELAGKAKAELPELTDKLSSVQSSIKEYKLREAEYQKYVAKVNEVERYSSLYNPTTETELLNLEDLKELRSATEQKLQDATARYDAAVKRNQEVERKNAKIEVLTIQKVELEAQLKVLNVDYDIRNEELSVITLLAKAFSPSGFIAYKIESLVKDLENMVNEYLAEMSSGRFQLSFRISSSDKLDVVISDNGNDIDIAALSNGELARVNVSTLLAIRKLMQAMSNVRTNLLILDETVESLDIDGKEKLIEVLLKEEHLNTILVSHGFSHPLLSKIEVIKTNNISRIE